MRLALAPCVVGIGLAGLVMLGLEMGPQPSAFRGKTAPADPPETTARECPGGKLSGPFTHDNLTVYLIHGPDQLKNRNFLTLPEALEQKKFVITETQQVNQLTMENLSADQEVVIFAGDILKGGQQDRIAQVDMIVPPRSGQKPLPAFCVEHTAPRWMRKLEGADKVFAASPACIVTNNQRIATRYHMNQSAVWEKVAESQVNLAKKLDSAMIKVAESDSSLALSIQVKEVQDGAARYVNKLAPVLKGKPDVIGYAFAINGKMVAADMYGSHALFEKVWPRLLNANAIEALTELQKGKKFDPVGETTARTFLAKSSQGKQSTRDVSGLRLVTTENPEILRFETLDDNAKKGSLRLNVFAH